MQPQLLEPALAVSTALASDASPGLCQGLATSATTVERERLAQRRSQGFNVELVAWTDRSLQTLSPAVRDWFRLME